MKDLPPHRPTGCRVSRATLLAALVALVAAAVSTIILLQAQARQRQASQADARLLAERYASAVEAELAQASACTEALAALVQTGRLGDEGFARVAIGLLRHAPNVAVMGLAPGGVVQQIYPVTENRAVLAYDLFGDHAQAREALLARESGRLTLAGPFDLVQGGRGFVLRRPVFAAEDAARFWGFAFVTLKLPGALAAVPWADLENQGYAFALWKQNPADLTRQMIARSAREIALEAVTAEIKVPNSRWYLSVAPVGGWARGGPGVWYWVATYVLCLALGAVARLVFQQGRRRHHLERVVEEHTAELRARKADLQYAQKIAAIGSWSAPCGTDPRAQVLECSTECCRLLGWADHRRATFGDLLDLVDATAGAALLQGWQQVQRGGRLDQVFRFPHAVEGMLRLRMRAAQEAPGSTQSRVVGTIQNVTEQVLAEEALRASEQRARQGEQRLELALEGAQLGLWDWNLLTHEVVYQGGWCRLLGYAPEEFPCHVSAWKNMVHPEDFATANARLEAHLLGQADAYESEHRMRHKDGTWRWVLERGKITGRTGEGRPSRMSGTHMDVTVRKTAELALRDNEAKLSTVFHASPILMAVSTEREGVVVEVNEAFLAATGYARNEIVGRSLTGIAWANRSARDQWISELQRRGQLDQIPLSMRTKQGDEVPVLLVARRIVVAGTPCVFSLWENQAERKQVEATVHLQSAALQAAANTIVITDVRGTIVWANRAAEGTGYSLSELLGHTPGEVFKSGHHDAAYYQGLWNTILGGDVWRGEVVNRRKDGSLYTEEMTITPVKTGSAITHFVAVKQDVTERKRLEQQIRHAQKMEAVGELAGGVAHDYNNILASVAMTLELVKMDVRAGKPVDGYLNEIREDVNRGAALTRQLLTFSSKQAVQIRSLNLDDLVAGLFKMLRRLMPERIRISLELGDRTPHVRGDAGMIEQVITNLCVNARDAIAQNGTITVRTSVRAIAQPPAEAKPGDYVVLEVQDTGCGMSGEVLEHLFEPFFTTKAVGRGTGLGLSIVYGIARQHGGWVEVASTVGAGSTFCVCFPFAPLEAATPAPCDEPSGRNGDGELVLLAEDDAQLRRVLGMLLRNNGYRVAEAADGPAALKLWAEMKTAVRLLVSDMAMPNGLNGPQLLERLREDRPALPAVFCSGYGEQFVSDERLLGDRAVLLRKPFSAPELLAALDTLLRMSQPVAGAAK